MGEPFLRIEHLTKRFFAGEKHFSHAKDLQALRDVTVHVGLGRSVGIVGESGSGKSTLARIVCGLERSDGGSVHLRGRSLSSYSPYELRRQIQLIFQDGSAALNPRHTVANNLVTPLRYLHGLSRRKGYPRVIAALREVGLDESFLSRYPHELSGGQAQRIAIARALIVEPALLVADEPTSALDVSIQAQILTLLMELRARGQMTLLFISHDIAIVDRFCDYVVVMKDGRVVEQGPREQVLDSPADEYTVTLTQAARARSRDLIAT